MSALTVASKRCPHCETVKPLTAFYRDKNQKAGRASWCRPCTRPAVDAANKRRREAMGEEAWLASNRATVAKSRRNSTNNLDNRQRAAYQAAERTLRKTHQTEFNAIYRKERYERGLSV